MKKILVPVLSSIFGLALLAHSSKYILTSTTKITKLDSFLATDAMPAPAADANSEMTEEVFNAALNKVSTIYEPIFKNMGRELEFKLDWQSQVVNAYAEVSGGKSIVHMLGGLARYQNMTADSLILVACHEIGHHIGGYPQFPNFQMSIEGQSDYFATLKCTRLIFSQDTDANWLNPFIHDAPAIAVCKEKYKDDKKAAVCVRSIEAAQHLEVIIADSKLYTPVVFQKESPTEVFFRHPEAQCRMDTYTAGALCDKEIEDEVSATDSTAGVCTISVSIVGARPLCWYGQISSAQDLAKPTIEKLKEDLQENLEKIISDWFH